MWGAKGHADGERAALVRRMYTGKRCNCNGNIWDRVDADTPPPGGGGVLGDAWLFPFLSRIRPLACRCSPTNKGGEPIHHNVNPIRHEDRFRQRVDVAEAHHRPARVCTEGLTATQPTPIFPAAINGGDRCTIRIKNNSEYRTVVNRCGKNVPIITEAVTTSLLLSVLHTHRLLVVVEDLWYR